MESSHLTLPLSWYFDEAIWAIESRELFRAGAHYVGHEQIVPAVGDYHVVPGTGGREVLVRSPAGSATLLNNVCRHRQALILEGQGNVKSIHCPSHAWTYNLEGKLERAPRFPVAPRDCDLARHEVQSWRGLLFSGPRRVADDLAAWSAPPSVDLTHYRRERVVVDEYEGNWKVFTEVYIEMYHVPGNHPGLRRFLECDDQRWELGEQFSSVTVGLSDLKHPATPTYARYHAAVEERIAKHGRPSFGVMWLLYYPGIMIECYPWQVVVSILVPTSAQRYTNIAEFYYPADVVEHDRGFVEASMDAYLETASEDQDTLRRLTAGRLALYRAGQEDAGPIHPKWEHGIPHLYDYLRSRIGAPGIAR